ncbi:hypothetical protein UFOVP239_38 [uncultured Caudovirales phage]|uniref:Uncharacterized protein n=1 Tax=uncultured Caudovirales phage TaxID=2100421 RepID=A0A6J7WQ57_9CAUD|nr:hypothetical protein UFOVP239_38 [uncultured Caudovirales phage]
MTPLEKLGVALNAFTERYEMEWTTDLQEAWKEAFNAYTKPLAEVVVRELYKSAEIEIGGDVCMKFARSLELVHGIQEIEK